MKILCWLGLHDPEYWAISFRFCGHLCSTHKGVRFVCRRCGHQGEKCIGEKAYKIEFGQLVPDHKAWLGGKEE